MEQMWLRIKTVLGTAYRSPWLSVDIFFNATADSINSLSYYNSLILLGDFNINIVDGASANSMKILEFI